MTIRGTLTWATMASADRLMAVMNRPRRASRTGAIRRIQPLVVSGSILALGGGYWASTVQGSKGE